MLRYPRLEVSQPPHSAVSDFPIGSVKGVFDVTTLMASPPLTHPIVSAGSPGMRKRWEYRCFTPLPDHSMRTTMTIVGLDRAPRHLHLHDKLNSYHVWSRRRPVPTDQKVDWQQGGSRQINTTGHSTSLAITSVQLNGTGRPVLVHRISVRDEEVVGSNPATPTRCRRHVKPDPGAATEF